MMDTLDSLVSAFTEEDWALRQFLLKKFGHVTVETVVSGPGIANVYEYLCSKRCAI